MSYFAAAVVRDADEWSAAEVSLADAADVEDVADQLREVGSSPDISLLFVESDDTYLVILRLDQGEDLRVFGSDSAFAEDSRLGALLLGDLGTPPVDLEAAVLEVIVPAPAAPVEDKAGQSPPPPPTDAEPAGDADLLADLGVPAAKLRELCAKEGMLPSDITAEVCQAIGCGDEVEELRSP